MVPYLDTVGFRLRTVMPDGDVQALDGRYPGWIQQNLNSWMSRLNAQLRKRYGNAGSAGNALPLGQQPPVLVASGTSPPPLALSGRPTLGCAILLVQVTTPGALTVAVFRWSADNGVSWHSGVVSAATVPLAGTGLTLAMPAGTYATDNVYAAAPPVPETVLQWLTILTTWDAYQKRGRNPQDPLILDLKEDRDRALAEIQQAANSNDGLFDLPVSEDVDTAVTTGGPLGYSEVGPYGWTDIQAQQVYGGSFGGGQGCL